MIANSTKSKINESFDVFSNKIYWLNQLSGDLSSTKLLTDYSRAIATVARNKSWQFELSTTASRQIIQFTQGSNLAIYGILLACLKILLQKYTNNSEVIIGSPSYLKERRNNIIPLRSKIDENLTFKSFLLEVKNTLVEAYVHQDCDFAELARILNLTDDRDRLALSDVIFSLENIHSSEDLTQLNNPLTITCLVDGDKITGKIIYSDGLFQAKTIESIVQNYIYIIEQVINNPQIKISELEFITKKERELLKQFNANSQNYPVTKTIQDLFTQQVRQTPNKIAAVDEQSYLTYQELNEKANQIARLLKNLGVKPGEFIGIYKQRDVDFLTAILAILKVGAVYVPLDNTYPAARINYMLANSQVRFLLTDIDEIEKFIKADKSYAELKYLICLNSQLETKLENLNILGSQSFQTLPTENLELDLSGIDPAYMIYTSGSTGLPKGVVIRQGGAINHIYAQFDALNLNQNLTFLQSAPASSDISVWQFLAPILIGGKTVIVSTETVCQPEKLFQVIQDRQITLVELVPVLLRSLVNYLSNLANESRLLPNLQWMMVTGESVTVDLVNSWLKLYPSIPIVNAYGPSEAADDITQYIIERPLAENRPSVPIGKPLANLNLCILDRAMKLMPIGVPGEICVSGYGVGVGYWANETKTKSSFVPNPFLDTAKPLPGVQQDLIYKTGDLGKWLPDGSIEFLGRIDSQVKIRGFRIELGEIETVIRKHPAVRENVVVVRQQDAEHQMVAYIVPQNFNEIELVEQLRNLLQSKLPQYAIPSAFVLLEELPLTPSGKIDRRLLPAPETNSNRKANFVLPRTPIQELVAKVWCRILAKESIGIHDNFFDLGGHSLLATQVISRLREIFKIELPLRSLFEFPTIAELAVELEKSREQIEIPSIKPVSREQKLPLSFAQQRLWFFAQLEPNSPAYNIPAAFRLQGQLKIDVLVKTLQTIIQRHEILRTNFTQVGDEAVQIIHPALDFQPKIVDLVNLPQNLQAQKINELAEQEASQPFDLEKDLLLRVTLIRLNDLEHAILFVIHHIISDGWSMEILIKEIVTIYKALTLGKPSPLPELQLQYVDYAVWQRKWLQDRVLDQQLNYWKQQLGNNLSVLKLPIANPQPEVRTFRGGRQLIVIDKVLSAELKKLSAKNGVTLFMTLLAAFQTLLHCYTDREDLVIGTDIANRNRGEIESSIGFFVNQLVLRTDLSGNPTFQKLLTRVRRVTLDAYANQDLPFDKLVEALNPKRDLSYRPLFQVKMVLQNAPTSSLELPDLQLSLIDVDKETAEYDLLLNLEDTETGLNCLLKYDADLFNKNKIAELLENLELIISTIARQPELKLTELKSILHEADKQKHEAKQSEYQKTLSKKLGKIRRKSVI